MPPPKRSPSNRGNKGDMALAPQRTPVPMLPEMKEPLERRSNSTGEPKRMPRLAKTRLRPMLVVLSYLMPQLTDRSPLALRLFYRGQQFFDFVLEFLSVQVWSLGNAAQLMHPERWCGSRAVPLR